MLATGTFLPRTLHEAYTWHLVPFPGEGGDTLAILNPDSRLMLHPFTVDDDGDVYYQPKDGWLAVSVAAFNWENKSIIFRVHNNTLPGVGLKKMHVITGTINDIDRNFLRLEVQGTTFDGHTPVEWISFEDFKMPSGSRY